MRSVYYVQCQAIEREALVTVNDTDLAVASTPLLVDLPSPDDRPFVQPEAWAGPPVPKVALLGLLSSDQWEQFVYEWARTLKPNYRAVKVFAGSGDGGIDVAAMHSLDGLLGAWDCYQCKRYDKPLALSAVWPEVAKIIHTVRKEGYGFPDRYAFVASRGYSTGLAKSINAPAKFRTSFLDNVGQACKVLGLSPHDTSQVAHDASDLDFSRFITLEPAEILEQHKSSPQHSLWFGTPLPHRDDPATITLPETPAPHESKYLQKLMDIYAEKLGISDLTAEAMVQEHPLFRHYRRQREAFYSAESLRLFARDCVPPGTYENLQQEIFDGVIHIHELDYPSGYHRLAHVLSRASEISITANALIKRCFIRDRHGVCHQLANDDRLTWLPEEDI
jgi:hypothetical protein